MGAIGLLFGIFPGQLPIAADGSFEILTSSIYIPIFLIVFAPIAIGTGNYLYLLYPFAATGAAAGIANNDFVLWAANSISSDKTELYAFTLASVIAYMGLYAFYKPLWVVWQAYRTKPPSFQLTVGIYGVLFLVFGLGAVLLSQAGTSLYRQQQRERAAVRFPITKQFAALPVAEEHGDTLKSYRIYYPANSTQAEDADQVIFAPLKQWWNSDIRTVCKNGLVATSPTATYMFKETPGGIQYAEAVIEPEISPRLPEADRYKEYHNCFVVGYQRYDFIKTLRTGEPQPYSTATIIDAIAHGEQFWPACIAADQGFRSKIFAGYCETDDIARTQAMSSKAQQYVGAR